MEDGLVLAPENVECDEQTLEVFNQASPGSSYRRPSSMYTHPWTMTSRIVIGLVVSIVGAETGAPLYP